MRLSKNEKETLLPSDLAESPLILLLLLASSFSWAYSYFMSPCDPWGPTHVTSKSVLTSHKGQGTMSVQVVTSFHLAIYWSLLWFCLPKLFQQAFQTTNSTSLSLPKGFLTFSSAWTRGSALRLANHASMTWPYFWPALLQPWSHNSAAPFCSLSSLNAVVRSGLSTETWHTVLPPCLQLRTACLKCLFVLRSHLCCTCSGKPSPGQEWLSLLHLIRIKDAVLSNTPHD